jgi:hypothetical protein
LDGGQELLRPTGKQLQQQAMQAVDDLGASVPQFVTMIDSKRSATVASST